MRILVSPSGFVYQEWWIHWETSLLFLIDSRRLLIVGASCVFSLGSLLQLYMTSHFRVGVTSVTRLWHICLLSRGLSDFFFSSDMLWINDLLVFCWNSLQWRGSDLFAIVKNIFLFNQRTFSCSICFFALLAWPLLLNFFTASPLPTNRVPLWACRILFPLR